MRKAAGFLVGFGFLLIIACESVSYLLVSKLSVDIENKTKEYNSQNSALKVDTGVWLKEYHRYKESKDLSNESLNNWWVSLERDKKNIVDREHKRTELGGNIEELTQKKTKWLYGTGGFFISGILFIIVGFALWVGAKDN